MKKKCTNSKCRKVFTVWDREMVICPYCGKIYPRLTRGFNKLQRDMFFAPDDGGPSNYAVVISGYKDGKDVQAIKNKVQAIKIVCRLTGLSLREAKNAVKNIKKNPVIIRKNLSLLNAFAEKDDIDKTVNKERICRIDVRER